MIFEIHKHLLEDCHVINSDNKRIVLLNKNALIPWIILVPNTHKDWFDLDRGFQESLVLESNTAADFLKKYFSINKLNFASIGNIVPQLHLHIIGRKENDACWPKPVWGNLKDFRPYTDEELKLITDSFRKFIS